MDVSFSNKKLRKLANNDRLRLKKLGAKRAKLLNKRLSQLRDSDTLEDVRYQPGHFHELTHDRKGQWACDLDQPYRLIFIPHEDPIPKDQNGQYLWVEITGVEIIEITDYH